MRKILYAWIVLAIFMGSACQKASSPLCGGTDPERSLPWLKEMTDSLSTSTFCYAISRATYQGQSVFILTTCDPFVDSIPFLYDCEGNKLHLTDEDYRNLKFSGEIEPIWRNK